MTNSSRGRGLSGKLARVPALTGSVFPLGTHFAWHVLNAAVLYLLLRTAMTESGAKICRVRSSRQFVKNFAGVIPM